MKEFRAPGEDAARERTWDVVRTAFEQRERVSWPRRHLRVAVATAVAAAAVAALVSPPGRSFIHDLRKAVGVEHAQPALFSLPGRGRLLVNASSGVWVAHANGSKRLLRGYREASWSPHGRFLVAAKKNELAALEDDGTVHWTLARHDIRFPRWGGTRTDTRIAYACSRCPGTVDAIRVVGGDGRGDHWVAKDFDIAPAWRPGGSFQLAVEHTDGRVRIWDADTRSLVGVSPRLATPLQLEWSPDGSRLYVLSQLRLYVLDARAHLLSASTTSKPAVSMAVSPRGGEIALSLHWRNRSEVDLVGRRYRKLFAGPGHFGAMAWSPDGRWILVPWREANQWLFIRARGELKIRAVSHVRAQFESRTFPRLGGWCCPR